MIRLVIKLLIKSQKFKKFTNKYKRNSETVTNENDKEIPKEGYIYPENRKGIIDELRLM